MHKKIFKRSLEASLRKYSEIFPVVGLLGPRQVGKSTLIKQYFKGKKTVLYFDLENYEERNKIATDPLAFFRSNQGKVIALDEIQKLPDIFETMRGVIDADRKNGQFYVLGSASPKLIKQASESLTGRIGYLELTPFHFLELEKPNDLTKHWLRGGFPESYLAKNDEASFLWRESFIKNLIERDVQEFRQIPPMRVLKFFQLLAHYHAQVLNYSNLSAILGVNHKTVESYIDLLESMYHVRRLPAFFTNQKKRLIKSPKLYIRDSGLLHAISQIENENRLKAHPLYGFSFEGYVIENLIAIFPGAQASYYRGSNAEEVDLVLQYKGKTFAVEVKVGQPEITKKGVSAIKALKPDHIFVVVPSYGRLYTAEREYGWVSVGDLGQVVRKMGQVF